MVIINPPVPLAPAVRALQRHYTAMLHNSGKHPVSHALLVHSNEAAQREETM